MRVFDVLPVQSGERIIGPVPDEIQSLIARIYRLTEQVRESGARLPVFHELQRAIDELEERTHLDLGFLPDPEGEYSFAFRRTEDGTVVVVRTGLS